MKANILQPSSTKLPFRLNILPYIILITIITKYLGGDTMGASVLVGDSSSHGNVVIQGSPRTTVSGKPLSFVGAAVTGDPIPHPPNSIASSGNRNRTTVGGSIAASSGACTACGASISGSGSRTTIS